MPRLARFTWVALCGLTPCSGVLAQRVTGSVQRSSDGAPVAGAVVSVIDVAGATAARTISDEHGRYTVVWSADARRLRVVRIGLRPAVVTLPSGAPRDTTIDVAMDLVPALLDTVVVALNPVCSNSPDRRAAAQLWDQARAGLLTAIVTREAKPAQVSTLHFERRMDRNDRHVTQQRTRLISGSSSRPVVAARDGATFALKGFRAQSPGTDDQYFAPDADVMFDENFAATHCFGTQPADAAHRGQIGLAFEPTPERLRDTTLVDVRGVLWIDPAAAKLMRLEFRFTGLNPAAVRAGAGGSMNYRTMANGFVFVDEWTMSIPALTVGRGLATVVDLTESGSFVLVAKWPDGTHWEAPMSALRGRVADPADHAAVPRAVVAIDGLVDTTLTDPAGRFLISPMIPGRYTMHVIDTTLGHFVKRRIADRDIVVSSGDTAVADFDMRSRLSLLADLCKNDRPAAGTATIFGTVADGSGDWPAKLTIESAWLADVGMGQLIDDPIKLSNGKQVVDVDDTGNFKVCGVVRDRSVRMRVAVGRVPIADTTLTINRDSAVTVVHWNLSANLFAEAQRGDGASVSGRVVREGDGLPIADADVWTVLGDIHTRTDSAGQFHIYGLQRGPQLIQVRRIGFGAKRDTVTVRPGEQVTRQFQLSAQVTELDTVHTKSGMVKYMSPKLQGFEQRRAQGMGHFISEAELRKNDNGSLSSILGSHIPGIMMIGYKGGDYATSTRGHAFVLVDPNDQRSPRGCWVAVYVDGIPMYTGSADPPRADTTKRRNADVTPPPFSLFAPAPDMTRLPITDFAGVEFYSDATLPIQFNAPRFTNCGSLFLWTRER